jgi:hypothetical protein
VYCSKAKVSCKKPTAKKPTYKKPTAKKVEDHPHPEDHHGAGHTRKLQSADEEAEFEVRCPLHCRGAVFRTSCTVSRANPHLVLSTVGCQYMLISLLQCSSMQQQTQQR